MSIPIKRVFLDIDGVLACFSKACCAKCDIEYPSQYAFPDRWLDDKCAGKMWKYCLGYSFWFNIEAFPWANELHDIVDKHTSEWIYMTKPSKDPMCYAAKHDWINKHFGDASERLWITNGPKSIACRGQGDLLIDDAFRNINPWLEAGGDAFHWTEITPDYSTDKVNERLKQLKDVLEGSI